jgi:hypothetical protein
MRTLILSQKINNNEEISYSPPYNTYIDYCDFTYSGTSVPSLFDYDIVVLHFHKPKYPHGYIEHLPQIIHDIDLLLRNGGVCILLPESSQRITETENDRYSIYEWLGNYGIKLHDSSGKNIFPTGSGKTKVISTYLQYCPKYYQIIEEPKGSIETRLATVGETDITIGLELLLEKGILVLLPPVEWNKKNNVVLMMQIVELMNYYYEKSQKNIRLIDAPKWIEDYKITKSKDNTKNIYELEKIRDYYRNIEYLLFGTGEDLEYSVMEVFIKLGYEVYKQEPGANIDLVCKKDQHVIGVEVTGTKGIIKKDSKKIAQAWKYLYADEKARLIIVANTEYHLDPKDRKSLSYTEEVTTLLTKYNILLLTTKQLYKIWKNVEEEANSSILNADNIMNTKIGVYNE